MINDSERVYEDIYNMSTKYLVKLLPQNRRIHIPNIITNIGSLKYEVIIKTDNEEELGLEAFFSKLIYIKTGILTLFNNQIVNYLFNCNLRGIIDLYSCLEEMETPQKSNEKRMHMYIYVILKNLRNIS